MTFMEHKMSNDNKVEGVVTQTAVELAADPELAKQWETIDDNPVTDSGGDSLASDVDDEIDEHLSDDADDAEDDEPIDAPEGEGEADDTDGELDDDDEVVVDEDELDEEALAAESKDYDVETKLTYKVNGKTREAAIRSKGELSPATIKELTQKYELADGIQAKLTKERKEWDAERATIQSQAKAVETETKERVRILQREQMLDEPIQPLLNAIRNNPLLQRALAESKDAVIQNALLSEGFKGLPKDYNRKILSQTVENHQQRMELQTEAIMNAVDPVYANFMKAKGYDKQSFADFIGFAREQGIGFQISPDENGQFDAPENYAAFVERQLKSAYGLALEAGKIPKRTTREVAGKKGTTTEDKLRQREVERMKKKNRSLSTVTGSGSSTGGGRRQVAIREGETVPSALARDADIQKAWAKI